MGLINILWKKVVGGVDIPTQVSAADPLPVVQTGTPTLPTGAATAAKQDTGNTSLSSIDGKMTAGAGAAGAAVQRVVLATDTTVPNVTGDIASGSSDGSSRPVKLGAKYNSTLPTFTDGQRSDLQSDARGFLRVTEFDSFITTASITRQNNTTGYTTGQVIGAASNYIMTFANCARFNGGGYVLDAVIIADEAKGLAASPNFELVFFSANPAAQVDAASWNPSAGEMETLVVGVPPTNAWISTTGATGNVYHLQGSVTGIPIRNAFRYRCAAGDTALYGGLIARANSGSVANNKVNITLVLRRD